MAVTATAIAGSNTPYSLILRITGMDNEMLGTLVDKATLLGYLHEGPLKAYLSKLTDAEWAQLNVTGTLGDKIRIYELANSLTDATEIRSGLFRFEWVTAPAPGLAVFANSSLLEGQTSKLIEIRLNHSAAA